MAYLNHNYNNRLWWEHLMDESNPDCLTDSEKEALLEVIHRDQLIRAQQHLTLLRLKAELRNLRRRGARNASGEELSQGRCCARCKTQLGRIYNTGASCPRCRHRVCRQCREYRGSNGTDWLCLVCHKITEIQAVSGEWMNEGSGAKRASRRKFLASPADILKRSIRRSWTINGPPASWCAIRGSPELRAYQSLPRQQDYFEVVRSDLVVPPQSDEPREIEDRAPRGTAEPETGGEKKSPGAGDEKNRKSGDAGPKKSTTNGAEEEEGKFLRCENRGTSSSEDQPTVSAQSQQQEIVAAPRISQIKPPRIHSRFSFPEAKQTPPKSGERKSNIPILRRSSREFEDIRSPLESAKRSSIPQRYRGSTDDLRRSREDITAPSQIPKLFSPRVGNKDDRLKRQDSKDEIRYGPKQQTVSRKEERKDSRDEVSKHQSPWSGNSAKKEDAEKSSKEDVRSGIKLFYRKDVKEPPDSTGHKEKENRASKFAKDEVKKEENISRRSDEDDTRSKLPSSFNEHGKSGITSEAKRDGAQDSGVVDNSKKNYERSGSDGSVDSKDDSVFLTDERSPTEEADMVEKKEAPAPKKSPETATKTERKFEGFKWERLRRSNGNVSGTSGVSANMEDGDEETPLSIAENPPPNDSVIIESRSDECDESEDRSPDDDGAEAATQIDEGRPPADDVLGVKEGRKLPQDDNEVVPRKFSKEESSAPDDTDEVPNRRSSSHLSPEASPLSTRSSRYSPRESESEPTPALPRKTGESSSASQRVRDAITRTRRESNSSTRYESSGSESIRLGGHLETRRVRFGGGSGIEEVQRDSATSAGEDEPRNVSHNPGGPRDARTVPGALQGRAMRRRRQFDTQGSRRRGRSHARSSSCGGGGGDDLHHLQVLLGRGGCVSGDHLSPPQGHQQGQQQGQDHPPTDYRRLVFISSDSSSGREEDDADSSSGSSSLNGAPRSGLAQGLEDCDWDYFESGGSIPPLAHLQVGVIGTPTSTTNHTTNARGSFGTQTSRGHHGISLSPQDWSCCPGRGSPSCQACGGARGANVFPVPVPIPVPVPYPVPVPASLWNSGLTNPSMINCTTAELGALQLTRSGNSPLHPGAAAAAQWFAWPPRFIHDVNGARVTGDSQGLLDQRSSDATVAATFAFHSGVTFERSEILNFEDLKLRAELSAAGYAPNASGYPESKAEERIAEPPVPDIVKDDSPKVRDEDKLDRREEDRNAEEANVDSNPEKLAITPSDNETPNEEREGDESSADSDEESNGQLAATSASNSPSNATAKTTKMYHMSQGNSGSSSGRSSADSSDLEDSASHHFSRVFVVNDDSSTSDNDPEDVEDVEDSDSNREIGITLRRVTALPEDGPVVLRHVRFLDEDRGTIEVLKNSDNGDTKSIVPGIGGSSPSIKSATEDTRRRLREDNIRLRYVRNFDPEANEIYLVDSKEDESEHKIELKAVRSLDPDAIEERSPIPDKVRLIDLKNKKQISEAKLPVNEAPEPDSLMPEVSDNYTIVPDSLEINEPGLNDNWSRSGDLDEITSDNETLNIPSTGDIYSVVDERDFESPAANDDRDKESPGVLRSSKDKSSSVSAVVYDDIASAAAAAIKSEFETPSIGMSVNRSKSISCSPSSSLNLTGTSDPSTTGSSDTATGSEVSSDELHEYEVTAWSLNDPDEDVDDDVNDDDDDDDGTDNDGSDNDIDNGAVNNDLISSRKSRSLLGNDRTNLVTKGEIFNVRHSDDASGSTSDGCSTDEGGSSRLDSGVATGVEDTNPSGSRTDEGGAPSFETTPAESIDSVQSPAAGRRLPDAVSVVGLTVASFATDRSNDDNVDKRSNDLVKNGDEKRSSNVVGRETTRIAAVPIDSIEFSEPLDDVEVQRKYSGASDREEEIGGAGSGTEDADAGNGDGDGEVKESSAIVDDHTVNDMISIKIHEIFKSVERLKVDVDRGNFAVTRGDKGDDDDNDDVKAEFTEESGVEFRGERSESKQVEGGVEEPARGRSTAQVSSVERRPPATNDGWNVAAGSNATDKKPPIEPRQPAKNAQNYPGNRYKSLVMITQGTYQPVNVVTSDTTTLLQPEESPPPPPRGLAGYYHLALETAADFPLRNGTAGPRRPPTVKRPTTAQPRAVPIEPEVDSGLSVGSASESDDVQSVNGAPKAGATVTPSPLDHGSSAVLDRGGASAVGTSVDKSSANNEQPPGANGASGVVVILEEGLADDDSWVEEVSHDEDEQGGTTATEESSEDEANNVGDREEELRGYHRQAIDFTLHTIVEESCEESEAEPTSLAMGSPRKQRPPSTSELEKYFFFGLSEGVGGVGGTREADSLSETSSIYSEGLESLGQDEAGQSTEKNSPEYLTSSSSSRLEKYFLSDFLGFDRDRRDSDGSVGSDSEGRPSPEQRRKRLVRARGTGRSHSSSLDNLLALTQSSQNLSSQNSLQDLSMNPDSQETQSEGSSTETDGADDQMPAFGTDGQFDTVKRKKKKPRNLGTQSPRIPDDRNKTPEPIMIDADGDLLEGGNSEDDRAKTPQPDSTASFLTSSQSADSNRTKQPLLQPSDSAYPVGRGKQQQLESARGNGGGGQGNEVNLARNKQHSRDSGFIGSCDDLLQHQRVSTSVDGPQGPSGGQDPKKDSHHDRRANDSCKKGGNSSCKVEVPVSQVTLAPPNASLSRKDSFNNWSSDEETNLMMSKMRQFFKTMVANSNNGHNSTNSSAASPAPSPRLPGSSPRCRIPSQNRTKPPQLVYFENELTRLMKTVPGIRDEQVKEIVEYLSSEDTWSDSYDSSDYTSSDLEGAGGRRSALQEQISQSCQQIISKFDTTGGAAAAESPLSGKESVTSSQPAQPLNCRDTAFVYQKLVQSFTKMTGDGVSSDACSTPHSSPPLIAKVMHHIGSRLVALMHEVSEGGPAVQPSSWRRYPHHRTPSSASTTEDDDSTSDSANTPAQHQLPRSKSHDPLLLLNGHPATGYQEGEEREASDNERFSWRGSFESALMPADSRTKLSLLACSGDVSASACALAMAAKRRSAGDLLFNPKSLSREQLDRVRSCGSIGGGTGSIEDKIWSNRRRSSVPDANTRGESGASAGDDDTEDELEYGGDSRATTLPRGLQSAATATNSLPRLPPVSTASGPVTMHKAHSVHYFLQQHNNVKSARYRPPGFARNNLTAGAAGGPKRAVSAPGLQLPVNLTSAGKRETARSRRQAVSLTPDDGSSLSEACSTPIIGGARGGSTSNEDEMDRSLHASLLGTRASSSSLGARSDSMASVYSGAGEGRWCGSVAVRGEVEFALEYDCKQKTFEVRVTQCRDLAPVDVKRNRSDPYVKVYLLPDKSKGGKRKTKVKKHTLNPVFDETLKFHMSLNGLETRTLWLTVWHSDMFGRNDFLGEVRMALENKIFDDPTPRWYPLQERSEPFDDPVTYRGEVIVGLKFVPPDPTGQQQQPQDKSSDRGGLSEKYGSKARKSWSKGALHVLVKEARNLQTRAKHGGTCDPFCKSYLLPDKGRSGKQKTSVVRKCTGGSPVWGHTFVYKDVSLQELAERGLELTVWDHDRIASNEFLGGVRFNLGTGKHYGKSVEWMDATGRELSLWQSMLERPNFWVEGAVTLRPNLHNHTRNNST
ncbi:uncharacterized protein LOC105691685 isoform X1 [Athalia rosae]|uniref:uncharacterized protein LOC105691685 isoform X1 n=1 Tax=Athalia rosae TaxID=37344 RepID=UPI002033281C|nr:uncharacterized protein LOC105691685 isoform X1 [Athalia rosae]